jgi:hypothetical protein
MNDFLNLLGLAEEIVVLTESKSLLEKPKRKAANEQQVRLEQKFKESRDRLIDGLLSSPNGHAEAYSVAENAIAEIRATCDSSWLPALDYTSNNLLPKLRKEADRDPRVRKAIKAIPWFLAGAVFVAYFSVRFLSATPINHDFSTKEGIKERASALEKVIRYEDAMDTHVRRGGWIKGILFWPIEPTESEVKGASQFAGLANSAQQVVVDEFNCPAVYRGGDKIPQEHLDYLSKMADYLREPNVKWREPAIVTAVDAARAIGKC